MKRAAAQGEEQAAAVLSADDADWWEVFRGDPLPALIDPENLPALNVGFRRLWLELVSAQLEFKSGNHLGGAYASLIAVIAFLSLFRTTRFGGLGVPLHALESALWALDEGIVEPLLKPVGGAKTGRQRASVVRHEFKGMTVYVVTRLAEFIGSRLEAETLVAADLSGIGVRPDRGSGKITARTIRGWSESVSADIGARGIAALRHRMLLNDVRNESLDSMPARDAAKVIRERLKFMAQTLGQVPFST